MLTAAMERDMEVRRGVTDERINLEEMRRRARMREQVAAHLADLRREIGTPLKSLWLRGEDMGPLLR